MAISRHDATAVVIPTLGRAERVPRLLENLANSTHSPYTVYFVVERHDPATIDSVRRSDANLIFNDGPPTYAACVNRAYRTTGEPYLFLGADDIVFVDRWLEAALEAMKDDHVGVVGTVDPRAPLPDHSAHSLVRRRYVNEQSGCPDLRETVLYPYWHGYTDHELVGVAKSRGAYAYCEDSMIEHHHPGWNSLGRVRGGSSLDPTYRKGNAKHRLDTKTFIQRCELWRHLIDRPSPADLRVRKFVRRYRGTTGMLRYGIKHLLDAVSDRLRRPGERLGR